MQHLGLNLSPLLYVQVFQDAQHSLDYLANFHDRLHVLLVVREVVEIVGQDLPNYFFADHQAHFVAAKVLVDLDEKLV